MKVRVVAFARIREALGFGERELDVPSATTVGDLWEQLLRQAAPLRPLERSTRFARNGALVAHDVVLHDGDELALLPPVGGG